MARFLPILNCALACLALMVAIREKPENPTQDIQTARNLEGTKRIRILEQRVQALEDERTRWSMQTPPLLTQTASPTREPLIANKTGSTSADTIRRPTVEASVRQAQEQISLSQEQERAFSLRLLEEEAAEARYSEGKGAFYEVVEERRRTDQEMSKLLAVEQLKAYAHFRLRNR